MSTRFMPIEIYLELDRNTTTPLATQLLVYFRQAIRTGQLKGKSRLPSSRQLAKDLGISRSLVTEVYEVLIAEGYLLSQHGSGTYILEQVATEESSSVSLEERIPRWAKNDEDVPIIDPPTPEGMLEFRVCQPSTKHFPMRAWRACWRQVLDATPSDDYGPVQGELKLRTEIAAYVSLARGIHCQPDDIVITAGAIQAIDLISRSCLRLGDTVAFEDPGYRLARHTINRAGGSIVPISVDHDGMQVNTLYKLENPPLLVYTTPAHQFPTGERLSLARRLQLIEWAQASDSLIIEDDYDSEFRFNAPPLPALASLDKTGCVVYVGTFSKTLTPSLRLGYLIAPPRLKEAICRLKLANDYHTATATQQAVALFMQQGYYARHIRKMRRIYAKKLVSLQEAISPLANLMHLQGLEAGLHVFMQVREGIAISQMVKECAVQGLIVKDIQEYRLKEIPHHGLILGYGSLSPQEINIGINILQSCIR